MSASGDNAAPVIIKRKKVTGGDGHHGGAWKVAYADFVTAMMAFFLLMWLLNATTEQQRKGIADYFSPTIPINRVSGGGDGDFGGESVFSEETLPQNGTGATNQRPTEARQARGEIGVSEDGRAEGADPEAEAQEAASFGKIEEMLMGRGGESTVSKETRRHIVTQVTDEGLVIEIFDLENAELFEPDSDEPTPLLREIAEMVGSVARLVENRVAIEGHTSAVPVVRAENPVWSLSMARADQMRELLESEQVATQRMNRVTGHADREPAHENALSIRNNRLEVILLRSDQ
ncbi:chemotaxis protein MotB [Roseovarius atlanticus]|uniref:Chemotaxis protein MotB n=1 Tax=Roseovarius atlanticus TaxID=1641875 RepID=A0A0T5NQQ9_9RHOB|nr:flagellar motor protein MotB [Roseovarius atlanticus]KRS11293.1 chemotaxis protein MotB [Roseovarius atlanticus]